MRYICNVFLSLDESVLKWLQTAGTENKTRFNVAVLCYRKKRWPKLETSIDRCLMTSRLEISACLRRKLIRHVESPRKRKGFHVMSASCITGVRTSLLNFCEELCTIESLVLEQRAPPAWRHIIEGKYHNMMFNSLAEERIEENHDGLGTKHWNRKVVRGSFYWHGLTFLL